MNEITATAAGYGQLGTLEVARVGFGTMKLTGWPHGKQPAREVAHRILRRAVEAGVTHLDTAQFYDRDGVRANDLIREALHPYPDDLVIVTKLANIDGNGLTPARLRAGVEANLASLDVDRLDVVNLRVGEVSAPAEAALDEPLTALAKLMDEGLIRHIGISNVTRAQFAQARDIVPVACVQNAYNLVRRDDDPMVDACAEAGIAFVPFFPVGGFEPLAAARLDTIAARHAVTPQQVALAWLLARSPAMLLIPGTSDPAHLEQNIAAGGLRLSDEDMAELNRLD
jgi:aryl-alcohol dehydrogenase-like predicted oxidoreductase